MQVALLDEIATFLCLSKYDIPFNKLQSLIIHHLKIEFRNSDLHQKKIVRNIVIGNSRGHILQNSTANLTRPRRLGYSNSRNLFLQDITCTSTVSHTSVRSNRSELKVSTGTSSRSIAQPSLYPEWRSGSSMPCFIAMSGVREVVASMNLGARVADTLTAGFEIGKRC